MATSVFGLANSREQATSIISALKGAGFADNDISVLMSDKRSTQDLATEQHTKAPEGATTGAVTGGVVGGTLGLLAGIGALAIPGLGPFIAAGPIMAALSGGAVGAAVGGLTGALIGMGIPEYEAKRYEGRVVKGSALIAVRALSSERERDARRILEEGGAEDISSATEKSVPGRDAATGTDRTFVNPPRTANTDVNRTTGGTNW